MPDVSALGAAYLSGLGAGIFKNLEEIQELFGNRPTLVSEKYLDTDKYYQSWKNIIDKN